MTPMEWIVLVFTAVVVPWFMWASGKLRLIGTVYDRVKLLQQLHGLVRKMAEDTQDLLEMHSPGPDGVQEWKNPGMRQAAEQQVDLLRSILEALTKEGTRLDQLFQGQSEVKQAVQAMRDKR
jgi:hypothetical protein